MDTEIWIVRYRHLVVLELVNIYFQVVPVTCQVIGRFTPSLGICTSDKRILTVLTLRSRHDAFARVNAFDHTGTYDQ